MKGDGTATHLEVRGLFRPDHGQPACGKWSQRVTADPALVTCEDCKATLDFVMAGGERQ